MGGGVRRWIGEKLNKVTKKRRARDEDLQIV